MGCGEDLIDIHTSCLNFSFHLMFEGIQGRVKKKGVVGHLNYIIQLSWSVSMLPKKTQVSTQFLP